MLHHQHHGHWSSLPSFYLASFSHLAHWLANNLQKHFTNSQDWLHNVEVPGSAVDPNQINGRKHTANSMEQQLCAPGGVLVTALTSVCRFHGAYSHIAFIDTPTPNVKTFLRCFFKFCSDSIQFLSPQIENSHKNRWMEIQLLCELL